MLKYSIHKLLIAIIILNCYSVRNNAFGQIEINSFSQAIENFKEEYQKLEIPAVSLDYKQTLNSIGTLENLKFQKDFFLNYQDILKSYQLTKMSTEEHLCFEILDYEIELNLERIKLEEKWKRGNFVAEKPRIYDEAMGKEWYRYLLRKWIDAEVEPQMLFDFGLEQIEHVKNRIKKLQKDYDIDENEFYEVIEREKVLLTNHEQIIKKYRDIESIVNNKANMYFPFIDELVELNIEAGTYESLAIVPAFYYKDTFYYNFFNDTYDNSKMDNMYLHEAVPGHHYQLNLSKKYNLPLSNTFKYMTYIEGWGAYVEQYGKTLGIYKTLQDEYAYNEWDLIRSMRVVIDVGINYKGWSDEEALSFWKIHLKNKDDIANREINRIKKWPAQVITYKYGRYIFDQLKGDLKDAEKLRAFHKEVLKYGSIPVSLIRNHILKSRKK